MQTIIRIDNYTDELNKLERIHYEVTGRENILDIMINNGKNNTEYYNTIWEEYLSYLKAYTIEKQNFEVNCIKKIFNNKFSGWRIDFAKKEVIIYYE